MAQKDQSILLPKPTGTKQRALVAMTPQELNEFLRGPRTLTASTIARDQSIHSVAMWYGYLDGGIHMDAKSKSQKVVNLRRDPRITLMIHDGYQYDELHGVMLQGQGVITEDEDLLRRIVHNIFARYHNVDEPDDQLITRAIRNRVAISVEVEKVASWDHRKLKR
jgi:PPOX class probable F420-dependent enzyme